MTLAAFALLALAAAGCEDSVDPTVGVDAPFSVYGYLDPTADRQAIRVAPIALAIDTPDETIDAAVTSTDLTTGAATAWRDSLVVFADGTRGHIFVADLTPTPGTTVRIEARRSDGAVSTIGVAVPAIVVPTVAEGEFRGTDVVYPVVFEGAPRVLNGQLRLTIADDPSRPEGELTTLVVPTAARPAELASGVWGVEVPFLSATQRALEVAGLAGAGVRLVAADYVGFVTNAAWALPTEDPDALVEPGAFSNVEGGLGFVGAGYRATARWTPPASVQAAAGFAADVDEALVINELQTGSASGWVELYNPTLDRIDLRGYSLSDDQSDPRRLPLPLGTEIGPGGYLVVDLPFAIPAGGYIELYDRTQESVDRLVTERVPADWPGGVTYGSFPDGASFRLSEERTDLFKGPLEPTPNRPNRLGLDVAQVHEVYTEGAGGFVEVLALDPRHDASAPRVLTAPGGFYDAAAASGLAYGLATEAPGTFDLPQLGATLYLAVRYYEPRIIELVPGDPPNPPDGGSAIAVYRTRVVDVRAVGPQVPGRSVGYVPDAAGGWAQGLRPTPGAPNAAARRPH
ncbi:lamin tail domain-containing protein [Rubrivirga sp. IMCC45206]|uniref:lamin tail domain-containing protein n=1 Tax=Rubrivirga sp. IMCC45206 TaxID=3391614 RepID=UPI00398FD51D